MSKSEISRLRALLTARGDFWDLRWDVSQLERAWRNEVVTIPPLSAFKPNPAHLIGKESYGTFSNLPRESTLAVPFAKVYLNPNSASVSKPAQAVQSNNTERYRMAVCILSIEGVEPCINGIRASIFIVKGNPLILSSTPLPCFSSGTDVITLDMRPGEDLSDLSLQVIAKDIECHFAIPVDQVVEFAGDKGIVERSITMWGTQTGAMRGTCLVSFKVDREKPLSVSEIVEIRKTHISGASTELEATKSVDPSVDLLAVSRAVEKPLTVLKEERSALVDELPAKPVRRRRGGAAATLNFSVNNDLINTVIPEDASASDS